MKDQIKVRARFDRGLKMRRTGLCPVKQTVQSREIDREPLGSGSWLQELVLVWAPWATHLARQRIVL
jgi:hypothetical protein